MEESAFGEGVIGFQDPRLPQSWETADHCCWTQGFSQAAERWVQALGISWSLPRLGGWGIKPPGADLPMG